jgi:hypothetical protein
VYINLQLCPRRRQISSESLFCIRFQPMEVIPTPTAALVSFDFEHVEFAEVGEDDRAFTWRHSASQSSRDSGAAAMSSAAWNLYPLSAFAGTCLVRPSPYVTQASLPAQPLR